MLADSNASISTNGFGLPPPSAKATVSRKSSKQQDGGGGSEGEKGGGSSPLASMAISIKELQSVQLRKTENAPSSSNKLLSKTLSAPQPATGRRLLFLFEPFNSLLHRSINKNEEDYEAD